MTIISAKSTRSHLAVYFLSVIGMMYKLLLYTSECACVIVQCIYSVCNDHSM